MTLRPLIWIRSARKDLKAFPTVVQYNLGYALYVAQNGEKHLHAKPLKGFTGASVLEVAEDHDGDTFRAVYTVNLTKGIYVLHVFQKKSKIGIATPQSDIDLIKKRLAAAIKQDRES